MLLALEQLGLGWRVTIDLGGCPNCESPHPALVIPAEDEPFLHCWRGCSVEAFRGGLVQLLAQQRRAA